MSNPEQPEQGPAYGGAKPAANWYVDQTNPSQLRYWDGQQWTANVMPVPTGIAGPSIVGTPDPLDIPGGQPFVGFGRAISLGFKQYARFKGRSSRSEYWWWYLFSQVFLLIVMIPGYVQYFRDVVPAIQQWGDCIQAQDPGSDLSVCHLDLKFPTLFLVGFVIALVLMLPSLAVAVRRLHDTGKSGWWWFIAFVPFVGGIILIVFLVFDSQPMPNQYGDVPRKGKPHPNQLA